MGASAAAQAAERHGGDERGENNRTQFHGSDLGMLALRMQKYSRNAMHPAGSLLGRIRGNNAHHQCNGLCTKTEPDVL
jgi:hypothetical protein